MRGHYPDGRAPNGLSLVERILFHTDLDGPVPEHRPDLGPCHIWKAHKTRKGYGMIGMRLSDGRRTSRQVHAEAHRLVHGDIPEGWTRDHLCRNRACVNLAHIEAVPHLVNCRRGGNAVKTHCKRGHPFDEKNTGSNGTGKGHRRCRTCHNQWRTIRAQEGPKWAKLKAG